MDFDRFVARMSTALQIEVPQPANPYDGLYDDIGLDSVQTYELLIFIEALADNLVPPEEIPELFTLMDAYEYYERLKLLDPLDL